MLYILCQSAFSYLSHPLEANFSHVIIAVEIEEL